MSITYNGSADKFWWLLVNNAAFFLVCGVVLFISIGLLRRRNWARIFFCITGLLVICMCLFLMGMIVYFSVCELLGLTLPPCTCSPPPLVQWIMLAGWFVFCLGLCIFFAGSIIILMSARVKGEFVQKSKSTC